MNMADWRAVVEFRHRMHMMRYEPTSQAIRRGGYVAFDERGHVPGKRRRVIHALVLGVFAFLIVFPISMSAIHGEDQAMSNAASPDKWTAWMIERERNGQTEYVSGALDDMGCWIWTTVPLNGLHLCRRQDAEVLATECDDCRITQHEFGGD